MENYEEIRKKLFVTVVNTERNKEKADTCPHTEIEDLSILCNVLLGDPEEETYMVGVVKHKALREWGVSEEQLIKDALENSPKIFPPKPFMSVEHTLGMSRDSEDGLFYIATNVKNYMGAAVLFYPGIMAAYGRMLGDDYWILPSSIHEMLLLPDALGMSGCELSEMVRYANNEAVAPGEVLSDTAYHYTLEGDLFETAAHYMERTAKY